MTVITTLDSLEDLRRRYAAIDRAITSGIVNFTWTSAAGGTRNENFRSLAELRSIRGELAERIAMLEAGSNRSSVQRSRSVRVRTTDRGY